MFVQKIKAMKRLCQNLIYFFIERIYKECLYLLGTSKNYEAKDKKNVFYQPFARNFTGGLNDGYPYRLSTCSIGFRTFGLIKINGGIEFCCNCIYGLQSLKEIISTSLREDGTDISTNLNIGPIRFTSCVIVHFLGFQHSFLVKGSIKYVEMRCEFIVNSETNWNGSIKRFLICELKGMKLSIQKGLGFLKGPVNFALSLVVSLLKPFVRNIIEYIIEIRVGKSLLHYDFPIKKNRKKSFTGFSKERSAKVSHDSFKSSEIEEKNACKYLSFCYWCDNWNPGVTRKHSSSFVMRASNVEEQTKTYEFAREISRLKSLKTGKILKPSHFSLDRKVEPCSSARTGRKVEPCSSARTGRKVEPCSSARTKRKVEPCSSASTERKVEPCSPAKTERKVEPCSPAKTERKVEPCSPAKTERKVEPCSPAMTKRKRKRNKANKLSGIKHLSASKKPVDQILQTSVECHIPEESLNVSERNCVSDIDRNENLSTSVELPKSFPLTSEGYSSTAKLEIMPSVSDQENRTSRTDEISVSNKDKPIRDTTKDEACTLVPAVESELGDADFAEILKKGKGMREELEGLAMQISPFVEQIMKISEKSCTAPSSVKRQLKLVNAPGIPGLSVLCHLVHDADHERVKEIVNRTSETYLQSIGKANQAEVKDGTGDLRTRNIRLSSDELNQFVGLLTGALTLGRTDDSKRNRETGEIEI